MAVSVDNDFARFGAKSYAINKITSVEIREVKDKNAGCVIGIFGAIALILGAAALSTAATDLSGAVMYLIGAALFGYLTYAAIQKGQQITYQLFLITAASEQQAYESRDRNDVYGLRDQVETAMMQHSRGGRD